mmetsp:Transcript_41397/g.63104  ORF Transcript_41397/g.63104 Transcript_41397/m.63104 type:complete len:104 (+) Transcript_41397:1501-1812(+)
MTLGELMNLHRNIYNLVDNLHELFCRGTKDYKTSLVNVLAYNSSRQVASAASVPDSGGDFKNQRCYFDIIYAIQNDLELYNYYSQVIDEFRANTMQSKEKWLS